MSILSTIAQHSGSFFSSTGCCDKLLITIGCRVLIMDISQAAFGLDMRSASRIYFLNPVLNPQVEAQAIGRARRISQKKPVSVETLVLRDSIEEVIVERKKKMTQAEHRKCKSILDDRPIYNWILNARIMAMPEGPPDDYAAQMAPLRVPLPVFGRGSGLSTDSDDGLLLKDSPIAANGNRASSTPAPSTNGAKRSHAAGPGLDVAEARDHTPPPKRQVRFACDPYDD